MITDIIHTKESRNSTVICDGKEYNFDFEVSVSHIINTLIENGHEVFPVSVRFLEEWW